MSWDRPFDQSVPLPASFERHPHIHGDSVDDEDTVRNRRPRCPEFSVRTPGTAYPFQRFFL
jgi:hypothetical protein